VREAEQARATVDQSVKSLSGLRVTFFSSETRVRGHITRLNPALAKRIEALVEALDADRSAIADVLRAGEGEIPAAVFGDVSSELETLKARIDSDIARLQEQDMAGALRGLETERVLLRHRQVLNQLLPDVETFVADACWVKKASGAPRRSLNPRPLTDKETELFQAVIADDYKKQLREECVALDCNLPVELSARGERGQTIRSLTIKGGHSPNEILSEGEQRAVALADFLTEVGLNPANAGIVLDDPVTSQDHERKGRIALRLVREAEMRQVIVFTHDLVFLTMLAAAADDSGSEMLTHWVERDGEGRPGQTSLDDCPATTPQYRKTTKAKNTLRDAKAEAGSKRLELIQRGMGELRRTVEEIVPHYFLKQVVNRWSDRIIVTGLKKIDWNEGLVSEIIDTFEQLSTYIEGHSHTEEKSGAPPEPKDLETMIARVDELIRRTKAEKESRRRELVPT
jgi:energy-coupling factor transporter ATP-binding protein EcfA2